MPGLQESEGHAPLAPEPRPHRRGRRRTRRRGRTGRRRRADAAGAASTTTTTSAGNAAATAKYNAALKAVGTKGVHFSSVAKQNGATLTVTGDAGTTSGAQTLVVKNKNVTERMTARWSGRLDT